MEYTSYQAILTVMNDKSSTDCISPSQAKSKSCVAFEPQFIPPPIHPSTHEWTYLQGV